MEKWPFLFIQSDFFFTSICFFPNHLSCGKRMRTVQNLPPESEWTNRYRKRREGVCVCACGGGNASTWSKEGCWTILIDVLFDALARTIDFKVEGWNGRSDWSRGMLLAQTDMVLRWARSRVLTFFLAFCSTLIRANLKPVGHLTFFPCPVGKDFDRSLELMDLVTALEEVPSPPPPPPYSYTLLPLLLKRMRFFIL